MHLIKVLTIFSLIGIFSQGVSSSDQIDDSLEKINRENKKSLKNNSPYEGRNSSNREWLFKSTVSIWDTETRGVGKNARITELSLLKVINGKTTRVYSNDNIQEGSFSQVFNEIKPFIENTVLIAHNVRFDKRMLETEIGRLYDEEYLDESEKIELCFYDSLGMVRRDYKRQKLGQEILSPEKVKTHISKEMLEEKKKQSEKNSKKRKDKKEIKDQILESLSLYKSHVRQGKIKTGEDYILLRENYSYETEDIQKVVERVIRADLKEHLLKRFKEIDFNCDKLSEEGKADDQKTSIVMSIIKQYKKNPHAFRDGKLKPEREKFDLDSCLKRYGIDPNKRKDLDMAAQRIGCKNWDNFCATYNVNSQKSQRHNALPDVLHLTVLLQLISANDQNKENRVSFGTVSKNKSNNQPINKESLNGVKRELFYKNNK